MIGIIYSRVRTEEKLLLQAFAEHKQNVLQINPRDIILGDNKNSFKNCKLILNREISQVRSELILEYLELLGIKTINDLNVTRICNNKAVCSWVLQKAGIPTPKTFTVFSQEQAKEVAKVLSFPVVLKPIMGSWGRLISKVETPEALESIIEHKEAFNNPYHSVFYIQEYIEKPERDIRVLVVGNEPIAAMYRESKHWITNTALGSSAKKCNLDKELTTLVKKAVNVLGTEIAGVDIIETNEGYKVLEINSTTEFHGLQEVTEINIADNIVSYIIEKTK